MSRVLVTMVKSIFIEFCSAAATNARSGWLCCSSYSFFWASPCSSSGRSLPTDFGISESTSPMSVAPSNALTQVIKWNFWVKFRFWIAKMFDFNLRFGTFWNVIAHRQRLLQLLLFSCKTFQLNLVFVVKRKCDHSCSRFHKKGSFSAFRFSTYMDPSIDPCTNFYRYSCNKFHTQAEDQRRNFIDQQKDATLRQVHGNFSGLFLLKKTSPILMFGMFFSITLCPRWCDVLSKFEVRQTAFHLVHGRGTTGQ